MKLTDKQQKIIDSYGFTSPLTFLNLFPTRYELLETKPIDTWKLGDSVVIEGMLQSAFRTQYLGGKRSLTRFSVLTSDTVINVGIFNRPYLNMSHYKQGITIVGTVDKYGGILAKTVSNKPMQEILGINPTYPLKAGIKNHEVSKLIAKILDHEYIKDVIPTVFKERYKLLSKNAALRMIHRPVSYESLEQAARTLKYEEFLKYHLALANQSRHLTYGLSHASTTFKMEALLERLPYTLTKDQLSSLNTIFEDLNSKRQMQRLLQGDVGSGKTVVAFLSAMAAISEGYQVAFMVPTEILMQQHYHAFQKLFPEIPCTTLSLSTPNRNDVLSEISKGSVSMIFGTHALFSKSTVFHNLGYVIIDEQHRFGVEQRRKLLDRGDCVDLLMLSATPIPRTLANALYFDLEISTIETYPASRKPIITTLIEENSLRSIQSDLEKVLTLGEQIYVVCPAIELGERPGVRSVNEIGINLQKAFPNHRIAVLHGQLKPEDKDRIMNEFINHKVDILVSTTVIEVGVDVHNANTMVVYNAEQFGLATLHQLRGRVGRGLVQGRCYLLTGSKEYEALSRLNHLVSSSDGFYLSMQDLRYRGMGDALGTRQSGLPNFLLGDIEKDIKILQQAKLDAQMIVEDPNNLDYQTILNSLALQDYIKSI